MIKMKNDHARTSTTYIIQIDSPRSHTDSEIHHNSVMNIEFKFHNKTAGFEFYLFNIFYLPNRNNDYQISQLEMSDEIILS